MTDASQTELLNETFSYNPDTGSMSNKNDKDFTYDLAHAHAVAGYDGNSYSYDANGNQTERALDGENLTLVYDAENRLIEVNSDQPFTPETVGHAGAGSSDRNTHRNACPHRDGNPHTQRHAHIGSVHHGD